MRINDYRWILMVGGGLLALACPACCGGEEASGDMVMYNNTPYYLHFLHPDGSHLFVPPGKMVSTSTKGGAKVSVLVSPGQEVKGSTQADGDCCSGEEGSGCDRITARWEDGALVTEVAPFWCLSDDGSCPYVYASDGQSFVLEGEPLTGALNQGAAQLDAIALPHLRASGGGYRVRIATELEEVDYLDSISLEVVDHPSGTVVVKDTVGALHGLLRPIRPLQATDDRGKRQEELLSEDDQIVWEGGSRGQELDGKIRSWVQVEFPRTPEAKEAWLVVRGRNTQTIQDAYHAYMRQFGPGLPKLMHLSSTWPWYRSILRQLLEGAGFTAEVALLDGGQWKSIGHLGPIGPAGMQAVALRVPMPSRAVSHLKLRLAIMPGAWLVDSVRLSHGETSSFHRNMVLPSTVAVHGADAPSVKEVLALTREEDQRYLTLRQGQDVELTFIEPPSSHGRARTPILRVSGYYELMPSSPMPCVNWSNLFSSLWRDNAFARFTLKRLAWRDTLDRYSDEAGVKRVR